MSGERNYFYMPTSPVMGPTHDDLDETLAHLTGRPADPREVRQIEERLDMAYQEFAPGGDVARTTRARRPIR